MDIYVIILKGSPRADALRSELARVGLERARFVWRDMDSEDGIRGCFHSHVACLNMIAESNQMGLILEDDVRFTTPQQVTRMLQAASEYVGQNPDAIVTLGGIACGILRPVADAPCILRGPWLLTHAYIVSPAVASGLAASQFAGQHYDKFLANSRYELCMTLSCVATILRESEEYGSEKKLRFDTRAVAGLVVETILSGSATVYMQYVFRHDIKLMFVRNTHLAFMSMAAFAAIACSRDCEWIPDAAALILVSLSAIGGLLVALSLALAGALEKTIATSSAVVTVTVGQHLITGQPMDALSLGCCAIVVTAVVGYAV